MTAFSTRRIRLAVPLFVLALAAAAPADASGFAGVERFWTWLLRWVLVTGASDIGPAIDPDGRNGTAPGTTQGDIGPTIDPLGRNRAASGAGQGDIGPTIDPDGRNGTASSTTQGDIGPIIDPNGGKG
ncbi:MAG TPA: hypothetical protein VHN15_01350 [Thermoanaerobaculia bacterium]|nr:hypothetical protein [Thermoanaerobaculia bacterium]